MYIAGVHEFRARSNDETIWLSRIELVIPTCQQMTGACGGESENLTAAKSREKTASLVGCKSFIDWRELFSFD